MRPAGSDSPAFSPGTGGGPDVDEDTRIMAAVVARNDAQLLEGSLACLGFADDVVVLDMDSSDETFGIATRLGAEVISVPVEPIAERVLNVALDHGARRGADWVIVIAPDERVSERFGPQLRTILRDADPDIAGYRVAVPVVAFGIELQHGLNRSGGGTIRVLRPGRGRWPDQAPAHTEPTIDGLVGDLVGGIDPIHNHAFRTMPQLVEKLSRYASSDDRRLSEDGPPVGTAALRRAVDLLIRRQAWRDGFPGIVAASFPIMEAWLRDCYAWEAAGYRDVEVKRRERVALLGILVSLRYADAVRQRIHRGVRRVTGSRPAAASFARRSPACEEPERAAHQTGSP